MEWHIYYDAAIAKYQMSKGSKPGHVMLAAFCNFEMAYDYVTKLNHTSQGAISKWAVR